MKLAVLESVGGRVAYCDPDLYPIARGTPIEIANMRLPEIRRNREAYEAILAFEDIGDDSRLTDPQVIAIAEDYKQIQAIELTKEGGAHRFSVLVPARAQSGTEQVTGTVTGGEVEIQSRRPGNPLMCPICLAQGTRIQTPEGPVAVRDLAVGSPVWTFDRSGRRTPGTVLAVARTPVPAGHEMVRVTLADGTTVVASPGHPLADGRLISELRARDRVGDTRVAGVRRIPYTGGYTYDILPSGPTGTYLVEGMRLGTTLGESGLSRVAPEMVVDSAG